MLKHNTILETRRSIQRIRKRRTNIPRSVNKQDRVVSLDFEIALILFLRLHLPGGRCPREVEPDIREARAVLRLLLDLFEDILWFRCSPERITASDSVDAVDAEVVWR